MGVSVGVIESGQASSSCVSGLGWAERRKRHLIQNQMSPPATGTKAGRRPAGKNNFHPHTYVILLYTSFSIQCFIYIHYPNLDKEEET